MSEVYRLRRLVAGRLQPIAGDERLFATWREALRAARELGGHDRDVVTQSVLLDGSGKIVFPPDDLAPRTRGRWSVAPVIRFGPRAGREAEAPKSQRRAERGERRR